MADIFFKAFTGIIIVLLFSCSGGDNYIPGKSLTPEYTLDVTPFKPVLFNDDHNSEGFLAPLKNGKIVLIFRIDPGMKGDHVGTDGYIAKIYYDPATDKWGEAETVYNSHQYDDRNIHGGVTKEGRVVAFFNRFDGTNTEGAYYIYSDDNGMTWSGLQPTSCAWNTCQMFYNPEIDKYITMGCQRYLISGRDGINWEDPQLITDNQDYALSEVAGAWCGKSRMVALIRDDVPEWGHPLVQVISFDNGQTWSDPAPANIPPMKHWGAAPQLIYDKERDLLIALNSDRYSRPLEQNSLFIYTASPDDIFLNPTGWTLQHELKRPWAFPSLAGDRPLNQELYGYPTIAPINEKEYLVVFTERAYMDGSEQADLYYFRVSIDKNSE
jgi:hypothetical protein